MSYSKYIEMGGTIDRLNQIARDHDWNSSAITPEFKFTRKRPTWSIGDIYRIDYNNIFPGEAFSIKIRTLKVDLREYRFADTIEELEHIAMLHGVYKKD